MTSHDPDTSTTGPQSVPDVAPDPAEVRVAPEHPFTLAVDIGGTGLKGSGLDAKGAMVRDGVVLSAPHFITVSGPGSEVDPHLTHQWHRFDLAAGLTEEFGIPTKAANDADIQGAAV